MILIKTKFLMNPNLPKFVSKIKILKNGCLILALFPKDKWTIKKISMILLIPISAKKLKGTINKAKKISVKLNKELSIE